MPIRSQELMLSHDHLRHQAQTFDWFIFSFRKISAQIAAESGLAIEPNEAVLRADFERWHGFFLRNKRFVNEARREFILYAAGLMAREMLRSDPVVQCRSLPGGPGVGLLGQWPEGYCVFRYCAEVSAAILEEEYGERPGFMAPGEAAGVWRSLRENVREQLGYAVPFLRRLMGEEPDWTRLDLPPGAPASLITGPLPRPGLH